MVTVARAKARAPGGEEGRAFPAGVPAFGGTASLHFFPSTPSAAVTIASVAVSIVGSASGAQ